VVTLLHSSPPVRPRSTESRWSALAACVVTAVAFLALLAALAPLVRPVAIGAIAASPREERVTFITARRADDRADVPSVAETRAGVHPRAPLIRRDTGGAHGALVSSGSTPASRATPVLTLAVPGAPASVGAPSARLVPSRGAVPWTPRVVFDPFTDRVAPSAEVRDSLLRDLRDTIAGVARTRVMSTGQRDALIKEGALRTHVLGRPQLDRPVGDGTYSGRGSGGISVPLFEPGPSRAARVRDSISFAENRARLERLRLRADSLRRARGP
jgi:hypothetical protein